MIHSFLAFVSFLIASVTAANDWSQPCINGSCYWDVNANGTAGQASGTMKIWGPSSMLSDITSAAGWQILDCDQNATAQDIRLVCMNESASCNHLFQDGAENTLVRLPENCGASPFARVAKAWVSADQSLPDSIMSNLTRRDGSVPQVQALSLDTSWNSMDASKGNISLAIMGASFPGVTGTIDTSNLGPQRRSRLARRGFLDSIFGNLDGFNDTVKRTSPITVDKDLKLPPLSLSCNGFTASVNADIDTNFNANVTYGVVLAGTIIPPDVSEFVLFSNFDADIAGTVNLQASAAGTVDSGKIQLFQIGLPGLDIPQIFTLGPQFVVNGEVAANAGIDVDLTVGLAYNVANGQLFFPSPPSGQSNGGTPTPQDSTLKLSVSPDVQANASVTAHLIPEIDFGINVLAGLASATVYLDLDASATLSMQLDAQSNVTTVSNSTRSSKVASATSATTSGNTTVTAVTGNQTASATDRSVQTGVSLTTVTVTSTITSKATHSTSSSDNSTQLSTAISKSQAEPSKMASSMAIIGTASSNSSQTSSMHSPQSSSAGSTTSVSSSGNMSVATPTASPTAASSAGMETPSSKSSQGLAPRGNTTASGSVNGCVTIDTGITVNAGAEGSFLSFFSDSTQVTLFQKNFQLFKKCFGTATPQRRTVPSIASFGRRLDGTRRSPSVSPVRRESSLLGKRKSITCPDIAPTDALSLIDEVVSAASELSI